MKQISSFFEGLIKKINEGGAIKDIFIECALKETGISLDKKNVIFKNGIFYLSLVGAAKSEIFLKKSKIIEAVNQNLGKTTVLDIR